MSDLFGDLPLPEPVQQTPLPLTVSATAVLVATKNKLVVALPLAYALVAFARRVKGKLDDRRKKPIVLAVQLRIAPEQVSADFIAEWLADGLPNPQRIYATQAELCAALDAVDMPLARRAALSMVQGGGTWPARAEHLEAVDLWFPE